jgi:hypothetical protein
VLLHQLSIETDREVALLASLKRLQETTGKQNLILALYLESPQPYAVTVFDSDFKYLSQWVARHLGEGDLFAKPTRAPKASPDPSPRADDEVASLFRKAPGATEMLCGKNGWHPQATPPRNGTSSTALLVNPGLPKPNGSGANSHRENGSVVSRDEASHVVKPAIPVPPPPPSSELEILRAQAALWRMCAICSFGLVAVLGILLGLVAVSR